MNKFGEPFMGNLNVRFDEGLGMFWAMAPGPLSPASPAAAAISVVR
jgi:hypothetical protein